jgi:hypothetical protein
MALLEAQCLLARLISSDKGHGDRRDSDRTAGSETAGCQLRHSKLEIVEKLTQLHPPESTLAITQYGDTRREGREGRRETGEAGQSKRPGGTGGAAWRESARAPDGQTSRERT